MLDYFSEVLKVHLEGYLSGHRDLVSKFEEPTVCQDPMDEADLATARYELDFMLQMQQRNHKFIWEIEEALKRIKKGEFGICEECGDEITVARLKAQPMTRLCINCKVEMEDEERRKLGKTRSMSPSWSSGNLRISGNL